MYGSIYLITCLPTQHKYVGQTRHNPLSRWRHHCLSAMKRDSQLPLHRAIRKHGIENFSIETIRTCNSPVELDNAEIECIIEQGSLVPNGYNIKKGGQGGGRANLTEDHKHKIASANQRYWEANPDDERRDALSERNRSSKSRQRSSDIQKRRWANYIPKPKKTLLSKEERSRRISERMTGQKRGPYKNRGIKRGPRSTLITCPTCKRVMKFISKRRRCI